MVISSTSSPRQPHLVPDVAYSKLQSPAGRPGATAVPDAGEAGNSLVPAAATDGQDVRLSGARWVEGKEESGAQPVAPGLISLLVTVEPRLPSWSQCPELPCSCSRTRPTLLVTANSPVGAALSACSAGAGRLQQVLLQPGLFPGATRAESGSRWRLLVQPLGRRVGGPEEAPLLISWTDPGHTVNLSSSQWFGGYFCLRIVT